MSLFGKKKKITDEAGMSNLNNNAPVKTILDDLLAKNPKAHKFYCQLLGKRPTKLRCTHHHIVGHNLAAFPDNWDGDLSLDYHQSLSYQSTLPRTLIPPRHVDVTDPVTELLAAKQHFIDTFQKMIGVSHQSKRLEDYQRLSEDVSRCPQHFVNMAARLSRDPAPHFRSHYNWHYAGQGTLSHITLKGCRYLVHAERVCLHVSAIGADGLTPDLEETFTFHCGDNILEVACSQVHSFIALRNLYKVILLKLTKTGHGINIEVVKTFHSKLIYTSIEFDSHHQSVLYLTRINDTVEIVNLNTNQFHNVTLNESPKAVDNWNTVLGLDQLHFVHATSNALHVFDKRTNKKAFSISNHRRVCEDCNDITVVRKSEHLPFCLYFGTNHHLFCVDVRSMRGIKPKILMRWTHGMRCPPTLIATQDFEVGKEVIFLASQWPEDLTVIVNDTAHLKAGLPPSRSYMPFHPPSIFKTLENAQSNKLCLDPTLNIEKRLSTAITGLLIEENDERFEILTHNSLGDLTVRTLYAEHYADVIRNDFSEDLSVWTKYLRSKRKVLPATHLLNVSRVWAFHRCVDSGRREHIRRNRVGFNEEAIVQLFESEDFDKELLDAWNIN